MDTSDLQALLVVARKKSISQAAQAIHLTQSTLTTRLKKLENELGVLLLERSWKGVELTSHGNAALFHALKALKEMQALQKIDDVIDLLKSIDLLDNRGGEEHAGNDEFDQKIKIGITEPLGLSFFSPIAEELNCRFPNIKYDVLSEQEEFIITFENGQGSCLVVIGRERRIACSSKQGNVSFMTRLLKTGW